MFENKNTQESCKGDCLLKTGRVIGETGSGLKSEMKTQQLIVLFVCFVFGLFVCLTMTAVSPGGWGHPFLRPLHAPPRNDRASATHDTP